MVEETLRNDGRDVPGVSSEDALTLDVVRKVARLCRIDLDEAHGIEYQAKLARLMDHFARLRSLDLEGVEPMAHVGDTSGAVREDEPDVARGTALSAEDLAAMAPDRYEGFVRVPRVLGGDGSGA